MPLKNPNFLFALGAATISTATAAAVLLLLLASATAAANVALPGRTNRAFGTHQPRVMADITFCTLGVLPTSAALAAATIFERASPTA